MPHLSMSRSTSEATIVSQDGQHGGHAEKEIEEGACLTYAAALAAKIV